MPYDATNTPAYVPAEHRKRWAAIWNNVHARAKAKGQSDKDAETAAFKVANGVAGKQAAYEAALNPPPLVPPQNLDVDAVKVDPIVLTDNGNRIDTAVAEYQELAGAVKDADCEIVAVPGGISTQKGCCNFYAARTGADEFKCGECVFAVQEFKPQLTETALSEWNPFTVLLTSNWPTSNIDARKLQKIAIACTGTWHRNGTSFSITQTDLENIVKNFAKRLNEGVVIDYEHASENPAVARGGPIPAAGWIRNVYIAGNRLYADVEWTMQAEEMIKGGQYRYFSPAINWIYEDKQKGGSQGATLTSGALTNHPFLEELEPILLSQQQAMDIQSVHVPGPAKIIDAPLNQDQDAAKTNSDMAPQANSAAPVQANDATISVAVDQPTVETGVNNTAQAAETTSVAKTAASENGVSDSSVVGQAQTPAGTEVMADKKDTASVGGEQVNRKDFLYVPDPDKPSTWKLPVHDASHARNALARFNQAEIPAAEKAKIARKLVAKARSFGIDTSGFEKEHLCEGTQMSIKKIESGKFEGRFAEFDDKGKMKHLFPKNMTDEAEMAEYSKEMSDAFADAPGMDQPTNPSQEKEANVKPRGENLNDKPAAAQQDGPVNDNDADDGQPAVVASKKKLSDVEVLGMITNDRGRILLSEAARLAESGELDAAVIFRAQAAEAAVNEAIEAQKFLPKERKTLLRHALQDPKGFAELVSGRPSMNLTAVKGLADDGTVDPGQDLDTRVKALLTEHKSDVDKGKYGYSDALAEVIKANPELWKA